MYKGQIRKVSCARRRSHSLTQVLSISCHLQADWTSSTVETKVVLEQGEHTHGCNLSATQAFMYLHLTPSVRHYKGNLTWRGIWRWNHWQVPRITETHWDRVTMLESRWLSRKRGSTLKRIVTLIKMLLTLCLMIPCPPPQDLPEGRLLSSHATPQHYFSITMILNIPPFKIITLWVRASMLLATGRKYYTYLRNRSR